MTARTVSKAVEKQETGPVGVMWSRRGHFKAVLPESVDVEAFLGTAAGALYANPKLMAAAEANPDSLMVVLMRCAALGHLPGTDEFYLYDRKRKGRPEVAGTEGYRGIVERMYRSGAVAKVVVREVCANDKFHYIEGADPVPVHEIGGRGTTGADFFGTDGSRDRGVMVGVYAYAQLTTGSVSRVTILDRDDVMAARENSDSKDSEYSPWNRMDGGKDHPEFKGRSMWWKTASRRLEPWVPTSREYRREQLAASAAAASLTGSIRPTELPPPAAIVSKEIVDAEVVDDHPDASPAGRQVPVPAVPPTPPAEPAGDAPGPAHATTGQLSIIDKEFERLGYNLNDPDDVDAQLNVVARLGAAEISDVNQLTQENAADVIRQLKRCGDPAMLQALTEDGEVPGA